MKLEYYEIAIEVTRWCNFNCENYCMRGPKQYLYIKNEYIEKLLSNNFDKIYHIIFTGGEPTLNPDAIMYCVDKIIDDNLDVVFLDIVTNGSIYDEKIVEAARKFNNYNNNRNITNIQDADDFYDSWFQIYVSRDKYHDDCEDVSYKYSDAGLAVFDKRFGGLLNSGKSTQGKKVVIDNDTVVFREMVWNDLYLTANGQLSSFGDGSYKDLDENASDYLIKDDNLDQFVYERINGKKSEPSKRLKKYLKNKNYL